jgi:hypothetical protein
LQTYPQFFFENNQDARVIGGRTTSFFEPAIPAHVARAQIGSVQSAIGPVAFSSEVDAGSRKENASKHKDRVPLLIPSESEAEKL